MSKTALRFSTSTGEQVDPEESIFPLVSYNPSRNVWKCVGTAFFIQPLGGFVTAKHVFFNNDGSHVPTLYGIQTTRTGERHMRSIRHFVGHENADIGLGFLHQRRLRGGAHVQPELAVPFSVRFEPLCTGAEIQSFAFPLTEREEIEEGVFEFTFKGGWTSGKVEEYLEDGAYLVRNRCYQTSMYFEGGASGGPVFHDNAVVAINSSSMQLLETASVSYITPIDYLLDMEVPNGNGKIAVKELIRNGSISAV